MPLAQDVVSGQNLLREVCADHCSSVDDYRDACRSKLAAVHEHELFPEVDPLAAPDLDEE